MAQQSSIEIPIQRDRDAGHPSDRTGNPDVMCRAVAQPQVGLAPEGHIFLILPPEEVVTGTMAAAAAMEVERLAGSRKLPMLLVLSGVETLTRGARTVFGNAHSLQAVAVLGVSPVDRVIANFLLGGAVQPCPTRYFSTESEALAWLKRKATVA